MDQQKPSEDRKKSRKRLRRWIFWAAVFLVVWLFLGWGLPAVFDKRHMRNSVTDWAQHTFSMTTPVSIGRTDLALRTNLRTDLYIHDLEFDPPNPAFDLPWLQVDTIRASDQAYRLIGLLAAQPVIQLRDMIARFEIDQTGESNLQGLEFDSTQKPLPLMNYLDFDSVTFELMNDQIVLSTPNCLAKFYLNGAIMFSGDCAKINRMRIPVNIALRRDGMRGNLQAALLLRKVCYSPSTNDLSAELDFKRFPLALLKQYSPSLPFPDGDILCDLNVVLGKGQFKFSGEISGLASPILPPVCTVKGTALYDGANLQEIVIEAGDRIGQGIAVFVCRKNEQGKWGRLEVSLRSLNVSGPKVKNMLRVLRRMCRVFPSIHVTVNSGNFQGLQYGLTVVDIIPSKENEVNLTAEGKIGGGVFSIVAKGQSLEKWQPPQSFICSLKVPNAGDMLRRFSNILPRALQFDATSGKGELTLNYEARRATDSGRPVFLLNVQLNDVTVPTLTGGALLQELAGMRSRIVELENLCRRASVKPQKSLVYRPQPFSDLHFESLKISYAINPWRNGRLRGVVIKSLELGEIEGVGTEEDGGVFRMSLFVSKLPSLFYKSMTKISPQVLQTLSAYLKKSKLKIEVSCGEGKASVNPVYVQDVFRFWAEQQVQKEKKP